MLRSPRRSGGEYRVDRDEKIEREAIELQFEAWRLLALVAAEFASDPMSTQCFDRRVVDRVIDAVKKRTDLERAGLRPPVITDGKA